MRTSFRKWTSVLLVFCLLLSLLPVMSANAATARITITNPTFISQEQPSPNNGNIPRLTANPVTITATIENITDSQISELYYEITNVTTTNMPVVDKTNKAQKTGQYDIAFRNVILTEGLNKIVVKLGDTSVVSSAPAWTFYTPTTTLSTLNINGQPFVDGKMYPENPVQSTVINIEGHAPNASEVRAYLEGDPVPKNAYINNGDFFFVGDDINKPGTTANLKLRPGDNPITFMAVNNQRTFEVNRNLIYDNGKPFAFNAKIGELEPDGDPVEEGGKPVIKDLIKTPTIRTSKINLSAYLKNDLTPLGDLQYRFFEVLVGGQRFGPYNMGGAAAAPRAASISPTVMYSGHSETDLFISGQAIPDAAVLEIIDRNGASVDLDPGTAGVTASNVAINAGRTMAAYRIPGGVLDHTGSPYSVQVLLSGNPIHNQPFAITVNAPAASLLLPTVQSSVETPPAPAVKAGDPIVQRTLTFSENVDAADVGVTITTISGQPVATLVGTGGDDTATVGIDIPSIATEGLYKHRISYKGYPIAERVFQVDRRDPAAPVVNIPGIVQVTNFTDVSTTPAPTTLHFSGANLGNRLDDITGLRLRDQDNPAITFPLQVVDVRDTAIVATLANQNDLPDGTIYELVLEKRMRYPDGTQVSGTPSTFTFGSVANHIASTDTTGTSAVHSVSVPQISPTEVAATSVSIVGAGLVPGQLSVVIMNEDGTGQRNASVSAVAADGLSATADFTTVGGLTAGNYLLRIASGGQTLGQYPFVVADPMPSGFTDQGSTISVSGVNFGRLTSQLGLRFTPTDNPSQFIDVPAQSGSIEAGRKVSFAKPVGLSQGAYLLTLLYKTEPVGNPFNFSVSAAAMQLEEVAAWSRSNRYKVFQFSANLDIPSDKHQSVQFRFYNLESDDVPATTYSFTYVDPDLPYIESVRVGNGGNLFEGGVNRIDELPATLTVTADSNTNKVNLYLGDYTSTTPIYATSVNTAVTAGSKIFTFTLPATLTNGLNRITLVPSTVNDPTPTPTKAGENIAGNKTYELLVSNAPYVIVNNIYNGLVVRNPNLEITCVRPGDTIGTGNCISGRLVNVDTSSGHQVELLVNEAITPVVINPDDQTFYAQIANFIEGKNTIKFNIRFNGQIVTSSQYEVFVFSTEAPEFLSITPVETGDVKKYIEGVRPDTYATSETSVAFSGQFANATEIRLTVRMQDENGNPIVRYDRRYNNFGTSEPVTGNPNYFSSVNSPTSGQFRTNSIVLAARGETIFEFSITNASGITITRTISIVREPLPYVIVYPVLTNGQANINSNFIEIQLKAEGATGVLFGRDEAVEREVVVNGIKEKHYFYEASGLKAGRNNIRFTVFRGEQKTNGTFTLYNVNTPVEGAQYKTSMAATMNVFGGQLTLKFPRGTNFSRNEPGAVHPFLTADRKILFGIADSTDGRVDKYKHPSPSDGQIGNPNIPIDSVGRLMLTEPTGRFRPASQLFWIDAGTIRKNETDMVQALNGSGRLPYDKDEFYLRTREDMVVPTQRGTLTLKYDPVIRNDAWKYVTVYHFDIYEDYTGIVQGRWRNLGGVVDTRSNSITVPLETFGYYQVMYMDQSYDDVTGHPWARNELDTLYSKGIMLNKESSNFVPNDPITRGEFATMLVKIFDIPLQYTEVPTFSDVQRVNLLTRLYDYKYIETAASAGIVRGAAGGRFLPDNAITRQDAAIMIARAADLRLTSDFNRDRVLEGLRKTFTDADRIDEYARTSVEAVVKAGIIQGKENVLQQGQSKATVRFDPLETFTRAEAAIVAMRVLQDQKKIPR